MPGYSFNAASGNRTGGYTGLGNIQQFGYANPYGPYSTLPRAGTVNAQGSTPAKEQGMGGGGGADSTARQYLEGVVGGQNTPYNQTTRDSMYSQASGMNAAAEAGRNQQLAEQSAIGGASPSDPSYQRLIRQSMAARQGANQQAMGDIDRTANLANQQAQMSAADRLLGSEDERYALQQGYNQRATQMALGYLYGGASGGGPNNFNLAQERNQSNIQSGAYDRAQSEFDYQNRLNELYQDQAYNQARR